MSKSNTPLIVVFTDDVTIIDLDAMVEAGHVFLTWETYKDIREKPEVHLFLGRPFYNWQGPIEKKHLLLMTKAEREAMAAATRAEKAAKKAEKKSKQTTLAL